MYPEDRVLVGVIKSQRDLRLARAAGWYRIPLAQMPGGINAEYIAFFLSGAVFRELSGSIVYYARRTGVELAYRRDLLPDQPHHPRANQVYYRVALGQLQTKTPPVTNPTKRPVVFIHTTWDRFTAAVHIADLYSQSDRFVARLSASTDVDRTPFVLPPAGSDDSFM